MVEQAKNEPVILTPQDVAVLQRTVGNRAVQREVIQRLTPPASALLAEVRFNLARQEHNRDRNQLRQWVDEGANQEDDRRLRNAANLVLENHLKLYAVTKTGDSDERTAHHGEDPAQKDARFPDASDEANPGDIMTPLAPYNWRDLDDQANVDIDDVGDAGWELPGLIAVVNPSNQNRNYVWETLRHEGQHATDASRQEEAKIVGGDPMSKQRRRFEKYKTEYRAYNYEGGDFDQYSHTTTTNQAGYVWTEKQWHIFLSIFQGYSHTSKGWNEPNNAARTWFRNQVVAYKDPDAQAFNKYDAYTVLDFYKKLDNIPAGTADVTLGTVQNLLNILKAGDIEAEDAVYILYESASMIKKIFTHLSGAARTAVLNRLNARAGKPAEMLAFLEKLMAVPIVTADQNAGPVQAAINAAQALNSADADYIFLKNKAFAALLQEHLSGAALTAVVSARLSNRVPAPVTTFYQHLLNVPLQTHDVTRPDVQQLLADALNLDRTQAGYILTHLEEQLNLHLIGRANQAVTGRLRKRAGL